MSKIKCAVHVKHFHWGMGEMGTCDLRTYKSFNDIGEWSDICSIGKFEATEFVWEDVLC